MAKHPTPKKASITPINKPSDLAQDIRQRAYQLYEERGRGDGQELNDWLRAEKEIAQRKARATVA